MTPDPSENPLDNPKVISSAAERQSSGWDIRNAPGNYISLILLQIAGALFSFGAVWLITRFLGSEGYGGIVAIIAASQTAQILVAWTGIAVIRFGVEEFIETEKIARVFWTRFLILSINLALVLVLSDYWFLPLAAWLKLPEETFRPVIWHFVVTVLWLHIQGSLQGVKLPRIQGILVMTERMLICAGLFALTAAASLTPYFAIVCYIAAPAIAAVIGLIVLRQYIFARFSIDRSFVRKILAYSLPLLPFSLVGYFSGSYVDAVFISSFLSTRDLGVYSVATQMAGVAMQFPTLANTLLLPLFVTLQKEAENARTFNYFRNILPALTLLWGMACAVLAFASYFAVPLVFGEEFSGAALPLWILLAASAAAIPIVLGYSALSNATSTTYISMTAAILSSAVNVAANFVLIPKYGISGSAWATLLAYVISLATFAALLRFAVKTPVSWAFFAVAPGIFGAAVFTLYGNPAAALGVCLSISFLVAYFFRDSVVRAVSFLRSFGTV